MKKLTLIICILVFMSIALLGTPLPDDEVTVAAGSSYNGNIVTTTADIIVFEGARVNGKVSTGSGDIYIESNARVKKVKSTSGDISIDEGVTVDQTIENTDGSIRIKKNSIIKGDITTETGDIRVDGSTIKKSIKTRHGDVILKVGTYVKKNIQIFDRGHGENLETLDIYLGKDVRVGGNVTASNDNDQVELQLFGGEVDGDIRRINVIEDEDDDDCGGREEWQRLESYTAGDEVSYKERAYRAKRNTRGTIPAFSRWQWKDLGSCKDVDEVDEEDEEEDDD